MTAGEAIRKGLLCVALVIVFAPRSFPAPLSDEQVADLFSQGKAKFPGFRCEPGGFLDNRA